MRITLFIDALHGGGAQRQMAIMANLFYKYGHDVSVVTHSSLKDDYELHPNIKRIRLEQGQGRVGTWFNIFKYFNGDNFDVVISFISTKLMLLSLLFRRKKNIKIIVGERCQGSTTQEMMHNLYKYADYIVPNSIAQWADLCAMRPDWKHKIVAIGNYTDLTYYTPTPLPNCAQVRIAIFARYQKIKNCQRFLTAVKLLKESCSTPFRIDWYGHHCLGSQYEEEYVKAAAYVQENGLQEVVNLNDRAIDARKCIAEYDCLCLPSLREGFANTIAEGICCGRPILASDVSDNGIMVKNGVNGFLFDPTDEESICSALKQFIELPAVERQQMGVASRVLAEQLFDEEKFVNQYISLMR